MPKVLIVDDEEVYRRQLRIALEPDGHEIKTVSSGRQAIDLGARYRPDVLVADWMLKNHIHGLHVVRVLRAVSPQVRTVLVTGFASGHLRDEAERTQVCDFIEKPFEVERIREAVRQAGVPGPAQDDQPLLAVIEVDAAGAIAFVNPRAQELLAETEAGPEAASLAEVFPPEKVPDLDAAADHWVVATPRSKSEKAPVWHIRSQEPRNGDSRLIVLRRQEEPRYLSVTLVEMLLELKEPRTVSWPFRGRVLVVDDQALNRSMAVSLLEGAGIGCYAAGTYAEALRLLENDEGLRFVILDYEVPRGGGADLARQIRGLRPEVVIVGTSGTDRKEEFARAGVEHFLAKPWRFNELVNLLTGRVGNCIGCGLPLPLRQPKPGDSPSSWVCDLCGARYYAVLDEDFPADVRRNVRPAEPS